MVVVLEFYKKGFDEYMNVTLRDAEEVNTRTGSRRQIGELKRSFGI
jgi:small nuclear ribonucleoprotein (snRNP)-like protein